MLNASFLSVIQRMMYGQIGSGKRFLGPTRLRRVEMSILNIMCAYVHSKIEMAEVVKM